LPWIPASPLIAAGSTPVLRDLNGDGRLDIVAVNDDVSVLLGAGDGTFAAPVHYPVTPLGAFSPALGDLNGDGKPDIVVSTGNGISVLLNQGDGTFGAAASYVVPDPLPNEVLALGDVDGDGKLDVVVFNVVTNTFLAGVAVLLGKGDGSFGPAAEYPLATGESDTSVAVVDLNGDGKPDIVIAGTQGLKVLFNAGKGTFGAPVDLGYPAIPFEVAAADLDGNGSPDLVVTAPGSDATLSVLLNHGDGTFAAPVDYTLPWGSASGLAVADLNGDGKLDVVTGADGANLDVLLNQGAGALAPAVGYAVGSRWVSVGDVNGDGTPDLVLTDTDSLNGEIFVVLGAGDGAFVAPPAYFLPTSTSSATSVGIGDLNGDGKPDLAVVSDQDATVSVLFNQGSGTFGPPVTFQVGTQFLNVAVADLNGDGKPDLVFADDLEPFVTVLFNQGGGTFASPVMLQVAVQPEAVWVADLNGDGVPDLILPDSQGPHVTVVLGLGGGTFGPSVGYTVSQFPQGVAIGDMNGDGSPDLVVTPVGLSNWATVDVLFNDGQGAFAPPVSYAVLSNPGEVAVSDLDGDGRLDLVVCNSSSAFPMGVMLNKGCKP
jgi:hypothetical protein